MKKTKFKKNAQNITHKPETCLNSGEEMAAVQKQTLPSFFSIISVLSIVFYCVGFIRVETGGVLPYMGYLGMCGPKGYGFCTTLALI